MAIRPKRWILHDKSVASSFATTITRRTNGHCYIKEKRISQRMSILVLLLMREDDWACAYIDSLHNAFGYRVWVFKKSWNNVISMSLPRRNLHAPQIEDR